MQASIGWISMTGLGVCLFNIEGYELDWRRALVYVDVIFMHKL